MIDFSFLDIIELGADVSNELGLSYGKVIGTTLVAMYVFSLGT